MFLQTPFTMNPATLAYNYRLAAQQLTERILAGDSGLLRLAGIVEPSRSERMLAIAFEVWVANFALRKLSDVDDDGREGGMNAFFEGIQDAFRELNLDATPFTLIVDVTVIQLNDAWTSAPHDGARTLRLGRAILELLDRDSVDVARAVSLGVYGVDRARELAKFGMNPASGVALASAAVSSSAPRPSSKTKLGCLVPLAFLAVGASAFCLAASRGVLAMINPTVP